MTFFVLSLSFPALDFDLALNRHLSRFSKHWLLSAGALRQQYQSSPFVLYSCLQSPFVLHACLQLRRQMLFLARQTLF